MTPKQLGSYNRLHSPNNHLQQPSDGDKNIKRNADCEGNSAK